MDERTMLRYVDELQGQIDRLKKMINGGGGGGSVVINPEGSATADLEKIKSRGIIYGLNYNKNANRPQINGNLLTGNKNSKQLNIAEEMSEAAYAALSSKNENEIYFLTENAPIFTESDTVASSGITWSAGEDPDTYIATLAYSVVDTDTTGVVGVTCDNDLITIGDPTFSVGTVSVPMVCDDPSEITGDIEFVYTLEQDPGKTKIMHNGIEFALPSELEVTTDGVKIGKYGNDDLYMKYYSGSLSYGDNSVAIPSGVKEPIAFVGFVHGTASYDSSFVASLSSVASIIYRPSNYGGFLISISNGNYGGAYNALFLYTKSA